MSPRAYNMEKRQAAVEETRERIVTATMQAHNDLGIAQTTVQDIAQRADVAVGTVYRHFPTLEDAVLACGTLTMEMFPLPPPEEAKDLFRGLKGGARVQLLVAKLAELYEFWAVGFSRAREARGAFEFVRETYEVMEAGVDGVVDEALRPLRPNAMQRKAVRALLDHRFWLVLADSGLDRPDAQRELTVLVSAALEKSR